MIKAVIIDDEKRARQMIASLLNNFIPEVEVVGEADSALTGKEVIESKKPDLVFLDIEMPNGNGFTLLSSFQKLNFEVIFTTAYSEYALKAIKFSALDYLLKPIDLDELKKAVEKYKAKIQSRQKEGNNDIYFLPNNFKDFQQQSSKMVLPIPKGFKVVAISDINHIEASGSYSVFHFLDKTNIIVGRNLKYFEGQLSSFDLMRIHDSYIVNLHQVDRYIRGRGGQVVMKNEVVIDVSRNKKDTFMQWFSAR